MLQPAFLTMAHSPGKFEGDLFITELAWRAMLEGWSDESCGDVDTGSVYDLVVTGFGRDELDEMLASGETLVPADREFLGTHAAVILRCDSQGFVYGEWFESEDSARKAWGIIERLACPEVD